MSFGAVEKTRASAPKELSNAEREERGRVDNDDRRSARGLKEKLEKLAWPDAIWGL